MLSICRQGLISQFSSIRIVLYNIRAISNNSKMAAYPRHNQSPFRTASSSSSPRTTSRMTTSPPPLPLFSDATSSGNGSFRSKTSIASGSAHSSRHPRSSGSSSRTDANMALSKKAQLENDSMVYLDGPQVYTCGQCRTHLTSHDDIISKSFHGRKGELRFMSSADV